MTEVATGGVLQKQAIPKNFAIFIGKRKLKSLFNSNFIKERLQHIAKFSRTPILKNICERIVNEIAQNFKNG